MALHTGGSGADSSDNKMFAAASDQTALLPAEARSTGAPINEGFAAFNGSLALSLTGEGPLPLDLREPADPVV